MNIIIPGEPVPKARPRLGKGRWYTPKQSVEYEERVGWHAASQTKRKFSRDVALKIVADFYCTPRPVQKLPDLDNLLKSLLDGLQFGGVLPNDRQVVALEVYRWEGSPPRTEVTVEQVGNQRAVVPGTAR